MKKTILITGASGAIGSAIAEALAGPCTNLILLGHKNRESLSSLEKTCSSLGSSCFSRCLDISDSTCVNDLFNELSPSVDFCSPDILINNAGISKWGLITDLAESHWDEIFNVNVKSMYLFTKAVLPSMIKKQHGSIVNVSSMWGQVGASCEVAYSATKGAIIAFTKALAKEVGPSGINVNCIAPGFIETPMNSCYGQDVFEEMKSETPLGRLGSPSDIASVVKFLISPEASFITGQVLGVNGGLVI